ncbi:MAG: HAMP domain-containing protein [Deltaproteobacteria bacterium]|nr:HAMP domain-containing protein [Deltaproteobacteria bacterium]
MRRPSITIKYSMLVFLFILATSGLLLVFFIELLAESVEDQMLKRGEAMTGQLAYSASSLLLAKDHAKLQAVLNKAKTAPDILSMIIMDTERIVIAASDIALVGKGFFDPFVPVERSKCHGVHHDQLQDRLVFMHQSSFSDTPVGCVVVQFSNDALNAATRAASARVLVITGFIALAVILLSFLTLRRSLRPLTKVIEGTQRIAEGDFSARIEVRSGDEIGRLAEAFNSMAARTELFFRYVDKNIAERLARDEELAKPGGQLKQVSVLFGDMRSFTALSNDMPPSDVVRILNTYFDLFFELVHSYEGVVDKTMGDAIMSFFEAFETKDVDHSSRATMAAVAMRAAVDVMESVLRQGRQDGLPLQVRACRFGFSVATGRLIVGNIGSDAHMDYTVCGPAVNLSARLQEDTHLGQIIIDRFTAMDVENLVMLKQLPRVRPKGFSEAQEVTPYEVIGLKVSEMAKLRQLLRRLLVAPFFLKHVIPDAGSIEGLDETARKTYAKRLAEMASNQVDHMPWDFLNRS